MTRWNVKIWSWHAFATLARKPGTQGGMTRDLASSKLLQLHWCVSIIGVVLCSAIKNICRSYPFVSLYPANIRLDEDIFRLRLQKTSSRRLQEVLMKTNIFLLIIRLQKTSSRRLGQDQYICLVHASLRRFQNVLNASCKNVFKTFSRRLQNVFKTSSRRFAKTSSRCLANTSWRHLQEGFEEVSSS